VTRAADGGIGGFDRVATVGLLAFAVAALTSNAADADLWGKIRHGRDFLAHGVLVHEPYSYTAAGGPWLEHEWGAEILFAILFDRFGAAGLVLFKALLGGAALALLLRRGWATSGSLPATAVVFVPAVLGIFPWFGSRPQIFTHAFVALTLWTIDRCRAGERVGVFVWALAMVVWVNVHAGFVAGFGLLGVATAVESVRAWRGRVPAPRLLALALGFGGLAALASPFGPDYVLRVLPTTVMTRPDIYEWRAFGGWAVVKFPTLVALPLLAAVAVAALVASDERRDPVEVAILGVTAVLAFRHVRHTPFFLLACVWALPRHLASAAAFLRPGRRAAFATALVAGVLAGFRVPAAAGAVGHLAVRTDVYPVAAVRFMLREGATGNVAVDFDWGSYLLGTCWPRCRPSIDGRYEAAYPPAVYAMNRALETGAPGWERLLTEYPTEVVLLYARDPGARLVAGRREWTLVYRDPLAVVFVRNDLVRFAALVARRRGRPATETVAEAVFP
jgi:hypothetical protein